MQSPYEIIKKDGEWFVYDSSQDIFVNRHGYVADDGFFTREEAIATRNNLDAIHPDFLGKVKIT